MSKQTLILDSTQIQTFTECAQLWKYTHRDSIIPSDSRIEEKSSASTQGSYGHKLLERYYKQKSIGVGLADAMGYAMSLRADQICECGHDDVDHKPFTEVGVPSLCTHLACKCTGLKLSMVEINPKEKEKVLNRFREYCFTYADNDFRPPSPDAVEVGFSEVIYETPEVRFILEGKIDLYKPTRKEIQFAFVDHKWQIRERGLYKKSIQFRNYGMITNAQIAMINYIRLKDKLDKTTLEQVPITFAMGEHEWWKGQLIGYFFKILEIDHYANSTEDRFNMIPKNWGSCSGKFGYACDYTQLCNERDGEMRGRMLDQLYKVKPVWKPW